MNPLRKMTAHPLWDADDGPARPMSRAEAERLVETILDDYAPVSDPARFLPKQRWRWIVLAAAAMLLTFGALAATAIHENRRSTMVPPEPTVIPRPVPKGTGFPSGAASAKPIASGEAAAVGTASSARRIAPEPDADDLFEAANALRRQGRWPEATRTYERVVTLAPNGSKAYTARVLAASLRLEHLGDPSGALARYRDALGQQPHGVLSEEIRWGIAECFRGMGDRNAEVQALKAFIAAHPESARRGRADRRVKDLEGADAGER